MYRHSRTGGRDIVSLSGWLFADLLLALTMLLFISSVTVIPPPKIIKPTPTPAPTPLPRLELNRNRITISIDANGILQNAPEAIANVKQQIRAQRSLYKRSIGFVIIYGGAPDVGQVDTALQIASNCYVILRSMRKEGNTFSRASYYDPLYVLGMDINSITIDIYLFSR